MLDPAAVPHFVMTRTLPGAFTSVTAVIYGKTLEPGMAVTRSLSSPASTASISNGTFSALLIATNALLLLLNANLFNLLFNTHPNKPQA